VGLREAAFSIATSSATCRATPRDRGPTGRHRCARRSCRESTPHRARGEGSFGRATPASLRSAPLPRDSGSRTTRTIAFSMRPPPGAQPAVASARLTRRRLLDLLGRSIAMKKSVESVTISRNLHLKGIVGVVCVAVSQPLSDLRGFVHDLRCGLGKARPCFAELAGSRMGRRAVFVLLAVLAARRQTPTIDEFAHVPPGASTGSRARSSCTARTRRS